MDERAPQESSSERRDGRPDALASTFAAMLRAAAARWRFEESAGRFAPQETNSANDLIRRLDAAANVLDGTPSAPRTGVAGGEAPHVLLESEERFKLLVESVKDYAIFMLDPEGRVATWNAGAQRIKGYTAEEAIGRHFSLFYTPDAIGAAHPQHELEVATREGRYEDEGWRVRKDGRLIWANVVITALRDSTGRLRGFAKVTRDFTERKNAEEQLRQAEARFRLMLESVRDYAIFMLDPNGRVLSWNSGAERLKGYTAHEIIGHHFSRFYPPDLAAAGYPERELQTARTVGRYEEEGVRVRKDGTRFWANVVLTAMRDENAQLIGFAKVTRDLTEQRAAQEKLRSLAAALEERVQRRTEALEAANKELEAFSYSVSHDLRAPLRGLDGFSKMLVASAAAKLDAKEKDYLERIRAAAQRMSQLIDDMLEFSRLARAPVSVEPVDVGALVETVISSLRAIEPQRNVSIAVEPGLTARADGRLLRIAFENLLGNAWKFTRKQPAARIEVGKVQKDGDVTYFVRDNGVGFDMRYASKLFMPFQRLHSVRDFEGTGIGLATVHRIVQRHGGKLWAESTPGAGATFFFTLGSR